FFSSRRLHTRFPRDWSSDVCSADLYSLVDVVKHTVPVIPVFLLRYKLETNRYLKECRMPVVLIHGDSVEVIPYSQSLKLKSVFKIGRASCRERVESSGVAKAVDTKT